MIRCIYSPFTDIYFHLAAEEYLLKQGNEDIFMLWQDTPSVVIGKHQRLRSEVDKKWAEQERVHIARRFSGGGAVYHDLGNINLTFIETAPRLPEFVTYLQRTLDFLNSIGLMAKGDAVDFVRMIEKCSPLKAYIIFNKIQNSKVDAAPVRPGERI